MNAEDRELNQQLKYLRDITQGCVGLILVYIMDGKEIAFWDGDNIDYFSKTRIPYPKLFVSLQACAKRLKILKNASSKDGEWDVVLWCQPDYYPDRQIERYMKMTGIRYLGSPKQ